VKDAIQAKNVTYTAKLYGKSRYAEARNCAHLTEKMFTIYPGRIWT